MRRAGTDHRPIVRLDGCEDRDGAEALRGQLLPVAQAQPAALGPDEWWAEDLEGSASSTASAELGVVGGLLALPSCECLGCGARAVSSCSCRSSPTRCAM